MTGWPASRSTGLDQHSTAGRCARPRRPGTIAGVLRIGSIVLGVDDMARALAFWQAALGYVPRRGEAAYDWTVLVTARSWRST